MTKADVMRVARISGLAQDSRASPRTNEKVIKRSERRQGMTSMLTGTTASAKFFLFRIIYSLPGGIYSVFWTPSTPTVMQPVRQQVRAALLPAFEIPPLPRNVSIEGAYADSIDIHLKFPRWVLEC